MHRPGRDFNVPDYVHVDFFDIPVNVKISLITIFLHYLSSFHPTYTIHLDFCYSLYGGRVVGQRSTGL